MVVIVFLSNKIMITTYHQISYFGFNFVRKSTWYFLFIVAQNTTITKDRELSWFHHPVIHLPCWERMIMQTTNVLWVWPRKKVGKLQLWLQGVILNGSGLSHLLKSSCHLSKFAMATLSSYDHFFKATKHRTVL